LNSKNPKLENIGRIAKAHNIYFHTDAAGGIGQMHIDVKGWRSIFRKTNENI